MTRRTLPPNASVAARGKDGRMIAPAATRNTDALCNLLASWAPAEGRALEIASGTGQHISTFARRLPGLQWQPTEIDPKRRLSIDAYTKGLSNVATAVELDAVSNGWHRRFADQDLVVLINLVHLISWTETQILIAEIAQALAHSGRFILYGPFKRNGQLISDGDRNFHEALIRQDAEIGYKNDTGVSQLLKQNDLHVLQMVEMPANNLAFLAEKPRIG